MDVNADAYVDAMKRAGFQNIEVVDKSEEYRKHHLAVLSRIRDEGGDPDSWTQEWVSLSEVHTMGVAIFGRKA